MGEAKITLTAKDNASGVIDHVQKKLGILNKEGVATGITFALTTEAIRLAKEAFQRLGQEFMKGVERAKDFEMNLVYITNSMTKMDMTVGELSDTLHEMSRTFGVDVNELAVGMKRLTREQNSATESAEMLRQAQLFNIGTGQDLMSILDALDTTMGVFNLDTSNSGYILTKLNTIINTTDLSMQDISDTFGRLSPEIRESGYNLNDVVNILYALAQTEIGPRKLAPAFEKYLKGEGAEVITQVPGDAVKSIEEQANAAINTHKRATDVIGAAWDGMWESIGQGALDTIDFLNMKWNAEKGWYKEKAVLPGLGDTALHTDWMDEYVRKIDETNKAIASLTESIAANQIEYNTLNQDYERSTAQHDYMVQMQDATLAVQEQEDAIERLRRIANTYNLEQQSNNIELMKIQYGAMGRRGGRLTRGEQSQVRIIEQENMALRIKEAEQQLAMGQIQANGLQDAQDELDNIRRSHDKLMYQQELTDLNAHINDVYTAWKAMYTKLAGERALLLGYQTGVTYNPTDSSGAAGHIRELIARGDYQQLGQRKFR